MIPLTLTINNFLSYGNQTQTISFAPYKLICLSGKNGHGKSALLDALTWVLWGQARKASTTSKPDQGLVHLGEVEMMVALDFIFNGQKYRVKRSFSQKYGKPHTHVEFGMLDEKSDRFISLTDKTIRKTEEKIVETIGLDYDTFINTGFLRQGQSNEFSKKSAKERKEILSTILGLNHYDQTRKFILENIRQLQQKSAQHEHIEERITKEIEALLRHIAESETVEIALKNSMIEEESIVQKIKLLSHERETLIQKEEQFKLLINQHANAEHKQKELRIHLHNEIVNWRTVHASIIAYHNRTQQHAEKKELDETIAGLQKQLHLLLITKEKLLNIKQAINQEENRLNTELQQQKDSITKNIIELESSLRIAEKQAQESTLACTIKETEQSHLSKQLNELLLHIPSSYLLYDEKEALTIFERHKTLYRNWIERANRCKQEMTETHHKQELSNDQDNPSCSLCEQNLSQARKRFLQKKLHDTQNCLTTRFHRLKDGITRLKDHVQKEYSYIQLLEQRKKIVEQQTLCAQDLERTIQEQKALALTMTSMKREIAIHHTQIEQLHRDNQQKQKESVTLQALYLQERECMEILASYDAIVLQYETFQKKLSVLTLLLSEDTAHESLLEEQKNRSTLITQLKKDRTIIQKEILTTASAHTLLQQMITYKKSLEESIIALEKNFASLSYKKQELLEKKAIILHAQEKKHALEHEKTTIEVEKKKIMVQYLEEQNLAQAFSKDGIQALLIEEALPEIEYEANDLLARLTDNQAHISIESLRDLKKGGTRETLDINISDAQGVRPYELFSGGEAFRIDFALRIAISKLLARRAGTSLQTLIIDEGFGSQDDEGLQRIMDAIYTIQDDFEKIIIVSHLSAMKEQFPVHFVVTKKPQGSVVTVFEND